MKKINLKMVSVILILVLMTGNIASAYSAETGKDTDVNDANTVNADFDPIPETQNTENGELAVSDEAEIITGTEWWAEENEKTRDILLTGDGTVNYSVRPVWDTGKDFLGDAFVVEFYDENGQYFTTTSFGDAWYAGLPETTESTLTKMDSIEKSIIQNVLSEISVEISRSGSVFTITYTNLRTGEVYEMTADAKEMADTVYIHVFAQFGTFKVTEDFLNVNSAYKTSMANYEAVIAHLNEYYIEKYPQMGLEVISCQPSDEETYQQVLQDIMSDKGEESELVAIYNYVKENDALYGYSRGEFLCQLFRRAEIPAVVSWGYTDDFVNECTTDFMVRDSHGFDYTEWVLAYYNNQWIFLDPYTNRMLNNKEEICRWYYTLYIEDEIAIYNDGIKPWVYEGAAAYFKDEKYYLLESDYPPYPDEFSSIGTDRGYQYLNHDSYDFRYIDTNEPVEMGKGGYVKDIWNNIYYMKNNGAVLIWAIMQMDKKMCYFDFNGQGIDITDLKGKCKMINGNVYIAAGTTFKISPLQENNDKEYTWKSENEDIIQINEDGSLTVLAYGDEDILQGSIGLTCDDGKTLYVRVLQPEIVEEQVSLKVGGTEILNVVEDEIFKECKYIWTSSDNSIAEVDDKGKVTAKKRGTALITLNIILQDGTEMPIDKCTVYVAPKDAVEIEGMGWWQEENERTKDIALMGNGMVSYIIREWEFSVVAPAFVVEFYDENRQYFTTTSFGDAWYAGLPETTSSTFTKPDSIDNSIMKQFGDEILVQISRSGSIFTITYTNLRTGEVYEMTANTEEMADTVYVHVLAQVGDFCIAEPSANLIIDESLNLKIGSTSTINAVADTDFEESNYIWTTNDNSIAEVDGNGTIIAKKEGIAEIMLTVIMKNGAERSAKCTVVVTSDDTKVKQEKSGEDIYIIYDKDTISDDVNLEVEKIEENHNDYESIKPEENVEFVAYDINLRDNKNNKVQPKGSIKVRIPCPRGYIGRNCKVYYVSPQGKYIEMKSEYSGGFIVFETTHFSTYMLTADKLAAGETEDQTKYGDVNGDGDIDTKDAVLIKKYLAGYTGLAIDLDAGDVNGDEDITSADAVLLLKYLAGYNIVLGR